MIIYFSQKIIFKTFFITCPVWKLYLPWRLFQPSSFHKELTDFFIRLLSICSSFSTKDSVNVITAFRFTAFINHHLINSFFLLFPQTIVQFYITKNVWIVIFRTFFLCVCWFLNIHLKYTLIKFYQNHPQLLYYIRIFL